MIAFDYALFTGRNRGFISAAEQQLLRDARIFICGVGGMGGAVFQSLLRAGVGGFVLADADHFEVSNLNRQVFASLDTIGQPKTVVTAEAARRVNPETEIEIIGGEWTGQLDRILGRCRLAINAMDDVTAGIALYRAARRLGATVIDAHTSPLPSVTVVRPDAARPEERLGYPTVGRSIAEITPAMEAECMALEVAWVLDHSSSADHVDPEQAGAFLAGAAPRMSFAPMVITTGNLMCFEAIKHLLGRPAATDERGYFFNPWSCCVERA